MELSKDEQVKQEIVLNAQALFQQFGLKKTTMEDIAKSCGKAKSTLYHYFKSKEEVFECVVILELHNLRTIVKDKTEMQISLKNKINTYVLEFYKEITNKVNLYRIMKHQLIYESVARDHFIKIVEFEKDYVSSMMLEGFFKGEITGIEEDEINLFAEVMLAAIFGVVRYSLGNNGVIDQIKLEKMTKILIPKIII